jgi:hypothetical protein
MIAAGAHHRRSTWLLKTVAGAGRPCLFVGDSGTAKTATVAAFLAGLDPAAFTSCALGFSSRTSSADVQRAIEDCVEKRTKVGGAHQGGWGGATRWGFRPPCGVACAERTWARDMAVRALEKAPRPHGVACPP